MIQFLTAQFLNNFQWFGLEDADLNVNYEKQIVIYNVIAEEHPEVLDPVANDQDVQPNQIQDEPPIKQSKTSVEKERINELTFPEIAQFRSKTIAANDVEVQEYDNYTYSQLNECVSLLKSDKYNLYAIVTNVKREPSPTKNNFKLMSQVYITDPSCEGTYGYSDFQFR